MRIPVLVTLLTLPLGLACGGGGGDAPDASPFGACGPVVEGSERNTLQRAVFANSVLRKSCSPYYLDEPMVVAANLEIEAGVEIVACQGGCRSRITVNSTGRLVARGTESEPIVFTSSARDTNQQYGGQWTGILFLEGLAGSVLEHVVIEYAGAQWMSLPDDDTTNMYEFPVEGSILVDSTPDLAIANVTVRRSNEYAIALTTTAAFEDSGANVFAAMDGITLHNNEKGLWIPLDQVGTLGANICFAERDATGVCPAGAAQPAGVFVEAHPDSTNGRPPESITRTALWKDFPVPYLADYIDIGADAEVTISDGVELRMSGLGGIYVGVNAPGALKMIASQPGSIKVRHREDNPPMGDYWDGLYIGAMSDSRTEIRNVDLGYGGVRSIFNSQAPAMIGILGTTDDEEQPTVIGNHVHHSAGSGIHWNCQANPIGLDSSQGGNMGNTSEPATIRCAADLGSEGIVENWGCECPGSCPNIDLCVNP